MHKYSLPCQKHIELEKLLKPWQEGISIRNTPRANVLYMQASNSREHFMGFKVQVNSAFSSQQSNAINIEGNLKRYRAGANVNY
ncbi:hypothetical protein CFP56_020302 [Quercus suber]|uniref:Uncharacterized protein n=1 Tax=Quercus suber TaxID=58331 RepID=A0AAW0KHU6_QUESU